MPKAYGRLSALL